MNFGDSRLPDRFWDKTTPEPNTSCWLWTAYVNHHGYGVVRVKPGKIALAHRVAYKALAESIPDGLVIDHRVCATSLLRQPGPS